ncbi:MAG: hypothetical protein HQ575_00540 [Candidatus Omnitrophica bacterium]|nr:hypothetical protein [Candidatus Omnitrophota bacterium]
MLAKISKFIVGVLLIPVVIGITAAFFNSLKDIGALSNGCAKIFLKGVILYVVIHLFIFKPMYIYTVGHELMHAIATWICGGGVKSIQASKEGGQVETTKSNFFISLSPYFIPLYTVILVFLYFVIPFFIKIPGLKTIFFFLTGVTLSLHLIFTAEVLKIKQPDLINTGYLFSVVLIYIVNIMLVAFLICLLFKGVKFETFFYNTYVNSKNIYIRVVKQLFFV